MSDLHPNEQLELAREAELEEKWTAIQALAKDLEAKFEAELGGGRGDAFEILMPKRKQVGDGLVVIKVPHEVVWRRYETSKMGRPETHQLVVACLAYPDVATFNALATKRMMIVDRAGIAIAGLVGIEMEAEAKK